MLCKYGLYYTNPMFRCFILVVRMDVAYKMLNAPNGYFESVLTILCFPDQKTRHKNSKISSFLVKENKQFESYLSKLSTFCAIRE